MKLARLALTSLLALGCACRAEHPSAPATADAPNAASPTSAGDSQPASLAKQAEPATVPDDTIPAPFVGRWAADATAC